MMSQGDGSTVDMKFTIAHKLRRMMVLVSGTALLLVAFIYSIYGINSYYDSTILRLSSMAKIVGINSSAALSFDDSRTAEKLLSALNFEKAIRYAIIFDAQGKAFAKFINDDTVLMDKHALAEYIAKGKSGIQQALLLDRIIVTSDISFDGLTIGYIQIASSLAPLYADMAKMLLFTAILLVFGLALVYWLAQRLQHQFTKPVRALVEGMEKVSQTQNYDLKLDILSHDELGQITAHFNEMLEQMKKRDVALQVKTEEAVRLALEAKDANQSKSIFLANMSHEIRTPLNGVMGLLRRLSALSLQGEAAKNYLNSAQQASNDLLALLNDILDFSKMEANSLQLENASIAMETFIQSSLVSFVPQVEEKGLDLKVEIKGAPSKIMGDPLRLRQILMNLVSNAVKFTQQGSVTLCIQPYKSSSTGDKNWLEIAVTDTGIGMSHEQVDRIFSAFSQGDESTTRRYGGTGLGLNIAKRLIELMGGELQVKSEQGKGSTFIFSLPFQADIDAEVMDALIDFNHVTLQPISQEINNICFDGQRVLLAEDNLVNQLIAKEDLEDMGLHVRTVENGKQVIEAWQEGIFDVILMDVHMPEMDGLEATRKIRELEQSSGQNIPIIALTANAMKEDFQRCMDAGMNDYVTKPFQPYQLASKLKNYLYPEYVKANEPSLVVAEPMIDSVAEQAYENSDDMLGQYNMPLLPMLYEPFINTKFIKEYSGSGSILLTRLRDGMQTDLDRMDEAATNNDWQEFGLIAHKMISSCQLIKQPELPNLLRSMQICGEAGRAADCLERLDILCACVCKISDEANEYLENIE